MKYFGDSFCMHLDGNIDTILEYYIHFSESLHPLPYTMHFHFSKVGIHTLQMDHLYNQAKINQSDSLWTITMLSSEPHRMHIPTVDDPYTYIMHIFNAQFQKQCLYYEKWHF